MTVHELLMLLAAAAARAGHVCPQLDSPQAARAAEQLLAAVGMHRAEPPRQITAGPDPTAALTGPTVMSETLQMPRAAAAASVPRRHRYGGWDR